MSSLGVDIITNAAGTGPTSFPFGTVGAQATYAVSHAIGALSVDGFTSWDATSGAITATLPTAVGIAGTRYVLRRKDQTLGNIVTVATTSSQTINGIVGSTLATQGETLTVMSDGSNWIATRYIPEGTIAYTPISSWVSNTTITGSWQRIGDSAKIKCQAATSGAPTATPLTINVPTGLLIDSTKLLSIATQEAIGTGKVNDSGSAVTWVGVRWNSTSSVIIVNLGASGTYVDEPQAVSNTTPITFGAGDFVNVEFYVPITNWSY